MVGAVNMNQQTTPSEGTAPLDASGQAWAVRPYGEPDPFPCVAQHELLRIKKVATLTQFNLTICHGKALAHAPTMWIKGYGQLPLPLTWDR